MSELLKSRHAFGSEANIDYALEQGLIDAYDVLFLKEGKIGWIDADGKKVILENKKSVVTVDALPEVGESEIVYIYDSKLYFWDGTKFVAPIDDIGISGTEVDAKIDAAISGVVEEANAYTDSQIDVAEKVKFEISSKPVGTLVNYSDKEIRVMCPADTVWTKQQVGSTGNANMYYMGFKAYAPKGAVGFKEGDQGVIVNEMFDFTGDFAGTDELGRNYSIVWLALASYNEGTDTWTYFGKNSTSEKYVGWDYVVEWYNADGIVIAYDSIRINLSNEECHYATAPSYVGTAIASANTYTDEAVASANTYTDEAIANAVSIIEF